MGGGRRPWHFTRLDRPRTRPLLFFLAFQQFYFDRITAAGSDPSPILGNAAGADYNDPRNVPASTAAEQEPCNYTGHVTLKVSDYTQAPPKFIHKLVVPLSVTDQQLEPFLDFAMRTKDEEWLQFCKRSNNSPGPSAASPLASATDNDATYLSPVAACMRSLRSQFRTAFTAACRSDNFIIHYENGVVITRGRYGLAATDDLDEWVGESLRSLGEWEQPIMDVASLVLRPGDTVWEGGAHIGSHTIAFARLIGEVSSLFTVFHLGRWNSCNTWQL